MSSPHSFLYSLKCHARGDLEKERGSSQSISGTKRVSVIRRSQFRRVSLIRSLGLSEFRCACHGVIFFVSKHRFIVKRKFSVTFWRIDHFSNLTTSKEKIWELSRRLQQISKVNDPLAWIRSLVNFTNYINYIFCVHLLCLLHHFRLFLKNHKTLYKKCVCRTVRCLCFISKSRSTRYIAIIS